MAGPAAEVLANLRGKLEGFQEHLPLIKALRNPGLRDRHWDEISQSEPCQILVWSLCACWLFSICMAPFWKIHTTAGLMLVIERQK